MIQHTIKRREVSCVISDLHIFDTIRLHDISDATYALNDELNTRYNCRARKFFKGGQQILDVSFG